MKQTIPVTELRRRVAADLNRRLGAAGTVNDLDIEWLDEGLGGATWGLSRISDDADPPVLRAAVADIIPRLQAIYDIEAPFGSPAAMVKRSAPPPTFVERVATFLRERPFVAIGIGVGMGMIIGRAVLRRD